MFLIFPIDDYVHFSLLNTIQPKSNQNKIQDTVSSVMIVTMLLLRNHRHVLLIQELYIVVSPLGGLFSSQHRWM